ncbi:MAG: iron ABC transporter permease [Methanotrichaceae archaeon]|nr:iron ABC transporter permease [Methanotrichaceae archaeon]
MYTGLGRWVKLQGGLRQSLHFLTKRSSLTIFALLLPLPALLISMNMGTYPVSGLELAEIIFSRLMGHDLGLPAVYDTVVFNIRLPRVLLAMLVGAALSISGATLQGIFRNPLVSPFVLGLSSGAAFGAALAIAVFPWMPLQIGAFAFSLLAVGSAYLMARRKGEVPVISLVLAGVVVSSVFGALLAIIQFAVDARSLQSIVYWNMGTLSTASWSKVDMAAPWVLVGCLILITLRWRLNVLALGEEEARSVGMNLEVYKFVFIVTATLVASAVVAVAGIIGLVGLIVPHMVRMVFGPDHRILIPLSATVGASFLVLVDDVARSAFSFEVPVGIITTLLGAPVFIYLLRVTRAGGWE